MNVVQGVKNEPKYGRWDFFDFFISRVKISLDLFGVVDGKKFIVFSRVEIS